MPTMPRPCEHVGLGRLATELDRNARWDRELPEDEQQELAFARLCLHKPRWIVIDDTLDTLDPSKRKLVTAMLDTTLKDSAIVNIGAVDDREFVTRTLRLVKDPDGRSFIPPRHKSAAERAAAVAKVPADDGLIGLGSASGCRARQGRSTFAVAVPAQSHARNRRRLKSVGGCPAKELR